MPELLFALSMRPGSEDEYRRMGDFLRGHRGEYGASRRRMGVIRHASWLASLDGRPWALVLLRARDFAEMAARSLASTDAFDVEWRARAVSLWGDQAWGGAAVPEVVVDVGAEDPAEVTQFLAGLRRAPVAVEVPEAPPPASLERVLVCRQHDLLVAYASGDVAGAFDEIGGSPWEPLLAGLYALPMPEPIIAWSADDD